MKKVFIVKSEHCNNFDTYEYFKCFSTYKKALSYFKSEKKKIKSDCKSCTVMNESEYDNSNIEILPDLLFHEEDNYYSIWQLGDFDEFHSIVKIEELEVL